MQTYELICKRFDFVDMVQIIVFYLHLPCKEFATNKEDVGHILRLVDIVKGLSRFRMSFAILDVHKLVIH